MSLLRIKMSPFGGNYHTYVDGHVEAQYEWVPGTYLQAGEKGLVVSRTPGKPSYTTAFVEAFPPEESGGGFFRGEGATVAEAETSAWNQYKLSIDCIGHEWEPRGYKNGGGFCKHCKKFGSNVFTGEQLGQFCVTCGEGTIWGQIKDENEVDRWFCEEHSVEPRKALYERLLAMEEAGELPAERKWELSSLRFLRGEDD